MAAMNINSFLQEFDMPKFNMTIEIEVEVEYTTDKELRQWDDARYPAEPFVDDFEYTILTNMDKLIREEAEDHLFHLKGE